MDRQTIQDMLDSLDLQLASGRIDLDTYQKLSAKWQARLAEAGGPAHSAAQPAAAAAEAVVCPECSAPLDDINVAPGSVVRCGYCRATFTFQKAQEQTEQARLELRQWLDQMVVDSGATGAVDATSRAFIFGEKVYPALQLEYRRAMEPYADAGEHPMVYLSLLSALDGYRPEQHILVRRAESIGRVRALSVKIGSPLVGAFALGDQDRHKLQDLNVNTAHLVYLSNVARLQSQPTPEGYSSAKGNVVALLKELKGYAAEPHEPGYAQMLSAVITRLEAGARVLDVLATILAPDADFAVQPYQDELDAARAQLEEAYRLADTCTYNPVALVPLKSGLERELKTLSVVQALLAAYHVAGRGRPLSFAAFYADMKALLATLCPQAAEPGELTVAMDQVTAILRGRRGEPNLHLINDWSWADKDIKAGLQRNLFGPTETVTEQTAYWHPFWYATVRYTAAKGAFFRSGVQQSGYGLVDAARGGGEAAIVIDGSPIYAAVSQALETAQPGDGKLMLPSAVSHAQAHQAILSAVHKMPELLNVKIEMEGLAYLPGVAVRYQGKSAGRVAVYSRPLQASPSADQWLGKVKWFFEQYA